MGKSGLFSRNSFTAMLKVSSINMEVNKLQIYKRIHGAKYSWMDQVKFAEDSL